MLNRSASLAMSTSVLKYLPGILDIKRHSPSILYLLNVCCCSNYVRGYVYSPCFVVCFLSGNHLAEKEQAGCFTLIALLLSVFFVSSSWCHGLVCGL